MVNGFQSHLKRSHSRGFVRVALKSFASFTSQLYHTFFGISFQVDHVIPSSYESLMNSYWSSVGLQCAPCEDVKVMSESMVATLWKIVLESSWAEDWLALLFAVRALVNLKAAFVNGEHELINWDSNSQSPCGWMGVTCNNVTFEVTAL